MFVDRAIITFHAGNGGNGCVSFRREKYVPRGGPDGGDGGRGGSIVLVSDPEVRSLVDFARRHSIRAGNGAPGSGSRRTGRSGADERIAVPPGTVVKTHPEERLIVDFSAPGMEFELARGGRGGRGNYRFKSSVNQAPRRADKGMPGESVTVVLELKLIAFAGLVGLPNAGKSTLISRISSARPRIADYPFTTLTPNLGVVYHGYDSLVVADIPGIISGAHRGEGMGLSFLRHIERNRVLLYLIDVSPSNMVEPVETLRMLQGELEAHDPRLLKKRAIVVGNKADLLEPQTGRAGADHLRDYCERQGLPYMEISALREWNLEELKARLFALYHES
ncbi:MAG: GTPase ObgE [Acidobacteriota bacterium]|jgi:GTP-binding protein|nr:GTPase ObgE [Acidobacteriota bacterium]